MGYGTRGGGTSSLPGFRKAVMDCGMRALSTACRQPALALIQPETELDVTKPQPLVGHLTLATVISHVLPWGRALVPAAVHWVTPALPSPACQLSACDCWGTSISGCSPHAGAASGMQPDGYLYWGAGPLSCPSQLPLTKRGQNPWETQEDVTCREELSAGGEGP